MIPFMIQHKCVVLAAVQRLGTRRTHTKGIAFYSTEAQATTGKLTYSDGLEPTPMAFYQGCRRRC
jgi:hypothetical protein